MNRTLSGSLVRFSFLLFLISAVGLLGLNGSLDPRNVTRIQAHDIIIELTSNSGNTLSFAVNANCVSTAMAPSDQCVAGVVLENTGEGDYTLTAPAIQTSGALTTCGGGGWFSASISNLSYAPNSHVVRVGDIETFNVNTSLSIDTPNDCQGLSAVIVITLVATATDDGTTPTPEATFTPTTTAVINDCCDLITPEPTSEVLGARATPEPTRTATARPSTATATPVATFTSEVLPSRFPSTGQGGVFSDSTAGPIRVIFLGIGLVAIGMLITALTLRAQDRSRS
jgi:hypothetical protein